MIGHLGKKLYLRAPVSGEVLQSNSIIEEESGKLQTDPYGEGWLLKVKPSDWKSETQSYHLAGAAVEWSGRELSRFRDFLAQKLPKYDPGSAAIVLQDGGEIRDNVLADMPDELWQDFQEEFLGKV
jgi:glycine cleavage system H protein